MIVEVFCVVGALIVGAAAARREKRPRCSAFGDVGDGQWSYPDRRCHEFADPVCDVGYCRVHCRDQKRCAGECIATRRKLLGEANG